MNRFKMKIATFLCTCYILSLLFSLIFLTVEVEHQCESDYCHICLQLNEAKKQLRPIVGASICFYMSFGYFKIEKRSWTKPKYFINFYTPITLKVQMNN